MNIKHDKRDWEKALGKYVVATGKTHAEASNRQLINAAIQTLKITPKADVGKIRSLKDLDWWPKFIAKAMASAGEYDADEAAALSKKIIGSRVRAASFVKSGLVKAIQSLGGKSSGKQHRNTNARVKVATTKKPNAQFQIEWGQRDGQDARKLERMILRLHNRGLRIATRDMEMYINKKLAKIASKYSG